MADNGKNLTKRETVVARMRERYPDRDLDDEEELFGGIDDEYNASREELDGYRERERGLADMFNQDPRSAAFLNNWREGGDPLVEMIRLFGDDFKAALEDPDRQEALAQANKEYLDRVTKNKAYEEEYDRNLGGTLANIELFQKESGASDEDIDAAVGLLAKIGADFVVGKVETSSLGLAMKAIRHAEDVAAARQEGEVAGRNAKIEERLRRPSGGNVPDLGGAAARTSAQGGAPANIFELARQAR